MKAYWEEEAQLHAFLISALDVCEWSNSRSGRFTPKGKSTWYPLDRRLGGLQSRSGRGGEERNSQPPPGLETSTIQSVAQRYATALFRFLIILLTLRNKNVCTCTLDCAQQICIPQKWTLQKKHTLYFFVTISRIHVLLKRK
jgi:hypothetical protein